MKTNSVKNGSEKNIEMFKMSNEELTVINGGGIAEQLIVIGPDGKPIIIIRGEVVNYRTSSFRTFFHRD